MADFSRRSDKLEIMDDLAYSGPLMDQTLAELEIINTWLGGNAVTMNALKSLVAGRPQYNELCIADLGCGRADLLKIIERWAENTGRKMRLIGIDANEYIINAAKKNLSSDSRIELQCMDIFSTAFQQQKFDVVIGTLFYHHFSDEQLITFFGKLKDQARLGFVINDIHRHPLAFYSIRFLTQFFSRSINGKI